MRQWRLFSLCTIAVGLTGCASMSLNECQPADWHAVGYEDGSKGQARVAFGSRRQTCAKHGVAPDFKAYKSGRRVGLKEYCQPERGFSEGRLGAEYKGVCPGKLEDNFLDKYTQGRALYKIQYAARSTALQIEHHDARIKDIDRELADIAASIMVDEASGDERERLVEHSKLLATQRLTLSSERDKFERDLRNHEQDLAEQEAQLVTQH